MKKPLTCAGTVAGAIFRITAHRDRYRLRGSSAGERHVAGRWRDARAAPRPGRGPAAALREPAGGSADADRAGLSSADPLEWIDPGVVDLVQRFEPFPTCVKGRRWDVLASNPAARELFTDWDALPPGQRNLVRWMFTVPAAREVYLEWEPEARALGPSVRLSVLVPSLYACG